MRAMKGEYRTAGRNYQRGTVFQWVVFSFGAIGLITTMSLGIHTLRNVVFVRRSEQSEIERLKCEISRLERENEGLKNEGSRLLMEDLSNKAEMIRKQRAYWKPSTQAQPTREVTDADIFDPVAQESAAGSGIGRLNEGLLYTEKEEELKRRWTDYETIRTELEGASSNLSESSTGNTQKKLAVVGGRVDKTGAGFSEGALAIERVEAKVKRIDKTAKP